MTTSDKALRAEKGGREVREQAPQHRVEFRAGTADSPPRFTGYASVTEAPYEMEDWLGTYTEVVRRGAFTKTLADGADVRLLLNHDGLPLARTKSGTLQLREIMDPADDPQGAAQTGLWCEADLDPNSSIVNDIRSAMERGDLDQMSFAFQAVRQQWSPDYDQRDLLEMRLFDVSVVTYPASPTTSASLRNRAVESMTDDEARDMLGRLNKRFANSQQPQGMSLAAAQAAALDVPPTV